MLLCPELESRIETDWTYLHLLFRYVETIAKENALTWFSQPAVLFNEDETPVQVGSPVQLRADELDSDEEDWRSLVDELSAVKHLILAGDCDDRMLDDLEARAEEFLAFLFDNGYLHQDEESTDVFTFEPLELDDELDSSDVSADTSLH